MVIHETQLSKCNYVLFNAMEDPNYNKLMVNLFLKTYLIVILLVQVETLIAGPRVF